MAAPARTRFQRERDLDRIAELYLAGKTQADIAGILSSERTYTVTRQTISRDLQTLQKRWEESAFERMDAARARELARVDQLERKYWEAWERSCGVKTITMAEESSAVAGKKAGKKAGRTKTSLRREERDGNPAYLAGVLQCIERRCKLLGLDAPERREILDVTRDIDDFRDETRENLIAIITDQLNIRRAMPSG